MKITAFSACLLIGLSLMPVASAVDEETATPSAEQNAMEKKASAPYTEKAEALAKDNSVSIEKICLATAEAVKNDAIAPSSVLSRVLACRKTWTTTQVGGLYKSVLMAAPELSASFPSDLKMFEAAGKPFSVGADAPEGVKLLAVLYGSQIAGVNADAVISGLTADFMGASSVRIVAPLRDVAVPRPVAPRRPQPTPPTPGPISPEN